MGIFYYLVLFKKKIIDYIYLHYKWDDLSISAFQNEKDSHQWKVVEQQAHQVSLDWEQAKAQQQTIFYIIPDIYMSSFKKKIVFFRCSQNTMKQLLFWTKKLMPYRIISGKLFTNVYIMQTMQQILFSNSEYDSNKSSSFHRFYTIFSFCKFKRQQMAIIVASCDPFRQQF